MKIIGTGLTGMVGSQIVEMLQNHGYQFRNLSLEKGVDITDSGQLRQIFSSTDADWLFHFAAKTDVDGCEKDKPMGKDGPAWKINAAATSDLAKICQHKKMKMLYISTDFVFDGEKEYYDENDAPQPVSWYGITKYEGEKAVSGIEKLGLIIRISFPYGRAASSKADFVAKIKSKLENGEEIVSPQDQIITPTYIPDIAGAIEKLIQTDATGIYHAVGGEALSPYRAVEIIARNLNIQNFRLSPVDARNFYADRAPRPLHAFLKNDKITSCGIRMHDFSDGIKLIL